MSFTASTRDRNPPILPLAGLVDIMFLLLIFFMTTSIFREQERLIEVLLPSTESQISGAAYASPIVITVTADDGIYMGGHRYDLDELRRTLAELPNEPVEIRGDSNSRLGLSVQIMDAAYAAGLKNVFLATTKRASEIEN